VRLPLGVELSGREVGRLLGMAPRTVRWQALRGRLPSNVLILVGPRGRRTYKRVKRGRKGEMTK
jgi:hypothetical protein